MKVTRLGPPHPLLSSGIGLNAGGRVPPGGSDLQVLTSNGSNGRYWGENVRRITSNGSNILLSPDVNIASGSGVLFSVSSNTLTVSATAAANALTVQDEGSSLATDATILNFVGAGVTASGTGANKTITITGGTGGGAGFTPPTIGTSGTAVAGGGLATLVLDSAPANGNTVYLLLAANGNGASSLSSTNTTWTKRRGDSVGGVGNLELWEGAVSGGAGGTTITITGSTGSGTAFAIEVASYAYSSLGANGIYAQQTGAGTKTTTILKGVASGRLVAFIINTAGAGNISPAMLSCPAVWGSSAGGSNALAFGFSFGAPISGWYDTAAVYYTLVDIVPA